MCDDGYEKSELGVTKKSLRSNDGLKNPSSTIYAKTLPIGGMLAIDVFAMLYRFAKDRVRIEKAELHTPVAGNSE